MGMRINAIRDETKWENSPKLTVASFDVHMLGLSDLDLDVREVFLHVSTFPLQHVNTGDDFFLLSSDNYFLVLCLKRVLE